MCRVLIVPLVVLFVPGTARADDKLLKTLSAVGKEGANSPAARAAWDEVLTRGPAILPDLLAAMDTHDTVAANWLYTAFDRIIEGEIKNGGKALHAESLLKFVKEPPRRLNQ